MSIAIDIEDAIVTRLETKYTALDIVPKVYSGSDIENIIDRSQAAASVFVSYNGIVGIETIKGNAAIITLTIEFILWVVTRSASRHDSQQGTREKADPIVLATLEALSGWRPIAGLSQLVPGESPGQAYQEGFGFFPLVFQTRRQVRGDVN
jgi:hypothetical protein